MEEALQEYVERVRALVADDDLEALDALLAELHPADVADVVELLDVDAQVALLKRLDTERAAEVLTEIDRHSGQTLLRLLSVRDVASMLGEMPSDDAADIMSTLPPETTERVDALLEREDRDQLRELMGFDEDSAGGIMEVERVAVPESATIRDAIRRAREWSGEIEHLQKIYVVDDEGRLVGLLNVVDLIVHSRSRPVAEVMERNLISVPVDMDQEDVASLFGKYDVFTLPVVDTAGRLVGRITVDDIIDVMEEEASEDIAHIAGTTDEELGEPSILKVSRTRLPWLITAMVGEVVTALVMSRNEATLQTLVVLAFFVPLIVATAGNVGIQSSVVVVRELALGHIDMRRVGWRVGRELVVAVANGIILACILFVITLAWLHDVALGALVCASLLSVVLVAAFMGASVPLLLHRWRVDPAIATGPFVTLSNDIIGLAIYLSFAQLYVAKFM